MASADAPTWNVLPHDPIEKLESNLWRVEGAIGSGPMRRVMTVVRLGDGGLLIHNAINMEEASMRELEEWGTPRFIIVPNGFHRMDCGAYKARYPEAQVSCPRAAVSRVNKAAAVDLTFDEFPKLDGVTLRHVAGTKDREGALLIQHDEGSTLVLNDLVFNMPHRPGVGGWILKHITNSSGGPRISRISKAFLVANKAQVAEDVRTLAATPGLKRLIVSHQDPLETRVPETLRQIADQLHA